MKQLINKENIEEISRGIKKYIDDQDTNVAKNIKNALDNKLDNPSGGTNGQVLKKTEDGVAWGEAGSSLDFSEEIKAINEKLTWRTLE